MKKLTCSLLTIILLFWTVVPTTFAKSENTDTNNHYGIEDLQERQIIENGVVKSISSFYYDGQPVEITKHKINDIEDKYTVVEGQGITEVIYNKETDSFIIDGELLEVDVASTTIKDPNLLKATSEGVIQPQRSGYSPTPPFGKSSDYKYVNTTLIDMRIQKSLGTIGAAAFGVLIAVKAPTSTGIAYSIAQTLIALGAIWYSNNYIKLVRDNYAHDLPFYKRYFGRFYYDDYYGSLGTSKVWYYSSLSNM